MKRYFEKKEKIITFSLFAIFLIIGISTFGDYGISIDEEFHRAAGFYWLNYILNFTPLKEINSEVANKLLQLKEFDLQGIALSYGVIFDVPVALLEVLFKIEDPKNYFYIKHFLTFLLFYIGSIFFYKLLINRFSNNIIAIIGTLFFVLSPRIYGNSFFNPKDIIFLSLVSIAIYCCFKLFDKITYKNFIIFSLFSALATSQRIFGVFIPLSFLAFYILGTLSKKEDLAYLRGIIFFCVSFFIFTIIFWPYLWADPFGNLIKTYQLFSHHPHLESLKMLFYGKYTDNNLVPYNYIFTWITITTPTLYLILFSVGYFFVFKNFLSNLINLKKNNKGYDFWKNIGEKKDLFIIFNITFILLMLIISNASIFTGWRHLYFINIFIIYLATYGLYKINLKLNSPLIKKSLVGLTFFYLFFIIYKIYNYHPYQNIYFNSIFSNSVKNIHQKFEIDYWGLTGKKALNNILSLEKNSNSVSIGVASYLQLERSKKLLIQKDRKRIKIVGQEYEKADYIYTNFMSEVDKKYDDKYTIPKSFSKINTFKIDDILIYELYKKNN